MNDDGRIISPLRTGAFLVASELLANVRWLAGYFLLLGFGIGLAYLEYRVVTDRGVEPLLAALGGALLALVAIGGLEWFGVLTGLMGIHVAGPRWRRVLLLWLLGPVWVLIQSPSHPQSQPAERPAPDATDAKPQTEARDTTREVVETVVFVVVLVLMLRTFVAEAFVIPTGSMAETLYGYQKTVACPECGFRFPVNAAGEVDPPDGYDPARVAGCTCPNCRFDVQLDKMANPPGWNTGDRVLVAKYFVDDNHLGAPARHDTFVFKYPLEPQRAHNALNYIKRCEGQPDETVAIVGGNLFTSKDIVYPQGLYPRPDREVQLREEQFMYRDAPPARSHFQANYGKPNGFHIVRKPPGKMLAMRRIVYDNDYQAADLTRQGMPARWQPAGNWKPQPANGEGASAAKVYRYSGPLPAVPGGEPERLTYQHLERDRSGPQLIYTFMGYNTDRPARSTVNRDQGNLRWVGDLMAECSVQVDEPAGEFVLELSRAEDRFQARFDQKSGDCKLVRLAGDRAPVELAAGPTRLSQYRGRPVQLRLANFDDRLTVWVGDELPFGDGVEYAAPASSYKPTEHNDRARPASVGATAGVLNVSHLRLWRDTFYTSGWSSAFDEERTTVTIDNETLPIRTLYVQPGHYLALGDNSSQSSDSRTWGLVPERLLLGKAVVVYWPPSRIGIIR